MLSINVVQPLAPLVNFGSHTVVWEFANKKAEPEYTWSGLEIYAVSMFGALTTPADNEATPPVPLRENQGGHHHVPIHCIRVQSSRPVHSILPGQNSNRTIL